MELTVKSNKGDRGNVDPIDAMDLIGYTMERRRQTREMMATDGKDIGDKGYRKER